MPRTRDERFERFKELLRSGLSARAAALQVGYGLRYAHSKSHLLAKRAKEAERREAEAKRTHYLPLEWWQRRWRRWPR